MSYSNTACPSLGDNVAINAGLCSCVTVLLVQRRNSTGRCLVQLRGEGGCVQLECEQEGASIAVASQLGSAPACPGATARRAAILGLRVEQQRASGRLAGLGCICEGPYRLELGCPYFSSYFLLTHSAPQFVGQPPRHKAPPLPLSSLQPAVSMAQALLVLTGKSGSSIQSSI